MFKIQILVHRIIYSLSFSFDWLPVRKKTFRIRSKNVIVVVVVVVTWEISLILSWFVKLIIYTWSLNKILDKVMRYLVVSRWLHSWGIDGIRLYTLEIVDIRRWLRVFSKMLWGRFTRAHKAVLHSCSHFMLIQDSLMNTGICISCWANLSYDVFEVWRL